MWEDWFRMWEDWLILKPTCGKPKAAKPPESASEARSTRPEVYSSRSEHLPEALTCIGL